MVTWDFFKSKRKLDILPWLDNQGLGSGSFEDFQGILASLGVQPITEADYRSMFPVVEPPKRPRKTAAQKEKAAATREAKKIAAQKRRDDAKLAILCEEEEGPSQETPSRSKNEQHPEDSNV